MNKKHEKPFHLLLHWHNRCIGLDNENRCGIIGFISTMTEMFCVEFKDPITA